MMNNLHSLWRGGITDDKFIGYLNAKGNILEGFVVVERFFSFILLSTYIAGGLTYLYTCGVYLLFLLAVKL